MPTYCYEKPDGSIVERIMTISEMEEFDKEPTVDGETWKRRIDVEMSGFNMANDVWRSGLTSESAACHPSDIPKFKEAAEKRGVPTNYDKWGRPSFTSRGHRAKYLKAFNMNDRNGGTEMAEKKPKNPPIGKIMRTPGENKKFKVYVKDGGKTKIVRFGDPNMTIKKNNPGRRKNFRARHNCDNPGPKTKARYWSCKNW